MVFDGFRFQKQSFLMVLGALGIDCLTATPGPSSGGASVVLTGLTGSQQAGGGNALWRPFGLFVVR